MGRTFSDREVSQLLPSIRAAFRAIDEAARPPAADPFARAAELQRSMERDYQAKLAKWERDRPKREAAEAAMQRAHEQRAAQLGARPARGPVMAALWSNEPSRPQVW
jgi:hypothetical protein